jgi:hypothetical protein
VKVLKVVERQPKPKRSVMVTLSESDAQRRADGFEVPVWIPPLPKPEPAPRRFVVELTEGEVDFLIAVTSRVGGDPVDSPRKYSDRIRKGLTEASGVAPPDASHLVEDNRRAGIFFRNYGGE